MLSALIPTFFKAALEIFVVSSTVKETGTDNRSPLQLNLGCANPEKLSCQPNREQSKDM